MNIDKDSPIYSIGTTSKIVKLSLRQIRYYEAKGLILPNRTVGKQRMYSINQIERLKTIKQLLLQGMNLEMIKLNISQLEEIANYNNKKDISTQYIHENPAEQIREKQMDRDINQFFRKGNNVSLYPMKNQEDIWRKYKE